MKWTSILLIFLISACSQPKKEIITEVVYQKDTIYVEAEKEKYPWDLDCADTADTQADMNICAGMCFTIADSLNEELYSLTIQNLNSKIARSDEERSGHYTKQKSRIEKIHKHFAEIRKLYGEFWSSQFDGGTMEPLIRLTEKTWIMEFEYQIMGALNSDIFEE